MTLFATQAGARGSGMPQDPPQSGQAQPGHAHLHDVHVWINPPVARGHVRVLAGHWPTQLGIMRGVILAWCDQAGEHAAVVQLDWQDRPGLEANLARTLRAMRMPRASVRAESHELLSRVRAITQGSCEPRGESGAAKRGASSSAPLPLLRLGTPFQHAAWCALLAIPRGTTCTYAQQARAMGCPSAVRAVAAANGQNFRSIVIPCHRVIGSDGSLTGYGGGLERKRWLIGWERDAVEEWQRGEVAK
jgi:O-6-methylguanine DNA methyltransferase